MAGDIKEAVVFGALNTGAAATTDFIKVDFGAVVAAKITLSFDDTDDANSATECRFCVGLTDFTNSRYVTVQSEDGSAKEDADCRKGVNDGYFLLTVGGGDDGHGDVTAIANGVRLTNQAAFGRAVFVEITLYGGADLAVDCGSHALTNRTPDVSTNSTTTGIDQDIVLFIGVDLAAEDSAGTAINSSYGVASTGREASQSIVNRCQSFTVDHNAAAGNPIGAVRNNRCLSITTEGAAIDWGIELTAADGTSFTTTIRDADPGAGMEVYYLALGFAAASPRHKSEVGSIDSPVVAGNWSKTGLGFKPGYVELGVNRLTAENTIAEDATAGSAGVSHNAGAGEETCHSFYDEFGTPTINTNNCFRSRAIYLFEDDGATIAYDLSHLTFNLDGWTYSQVGTPSGTASKWDYLAIEETAIPPPEDELIQSRRVIIQP